MKGSKLVTVGDFVKDGKITREDVVALAKQIFDGRRELPVGGKDCRIILRPYGGLSKHLQECVMTMLLTSEGVAPETMTAPVAADDTIPA